MPRRAASDRTATLSPALTSALESNNVLGELVLSTAGKWIIHPPTRCPNGHTLGAGQVLVRICRQCDATVYGPPFNTHCTCLDGPATVRISNIALGD